MISVVIPTYNRARDLDRCLSSLRAQRIDSSLFEIVVVNDGSTDDTEAVLRHWGSEWSSVHAIHQNNGGPANARNAGVRKARFPIIAFIDDDCLAPTDWLARIHSHYASGFSGCLHGPVHSSLPNSTFVHSVISDDGSLITANLAIPRALLESLGGLDPRFHRSALLKGARPAHWCEDEDLFYRIRKSGIGIKYDLELIVEHPPRYDSFWSEFRKAQALQFFGLIAAKHPEVHPLKLNGRRLKSAAQKLATIALLASAGLLLGLPTLAVIPLSVSPFVFLDWRRLKQIRAALVKQGIRVKATDQIAYILFNWATSLAAGYYLIKGVVVYRKAV
jgi:glycosyltransferase involved in cell wall biosynthesis